MNDITNIAAEDIKNYIEAIENYEAEKVELNEKLKEVFEGLKAKGFDLKTIKKILKLRKESLDKRREEQILLEIYANAIQFELF